MVMIFQSEKALRFLLEKGYVYTFRVKPHKDGRDWITNKRGGRKIADVVIDCWDRVYDLKELKFYVDKSGFASYEEWLKEILRLNGFLPKEGWLFRVSLLRG